MFLLGHWKNYDELEESLSFDELLITVNAIRDKDARDKKFMAMLQGIDLDEETSKAEENKQDIKTLSGTAAAQAGFGIGFGLGFMEVNE